MSKQPTVKILVGYHKPAKLYKSDVFVPIHLGRALATAASKDGKISTDDYQWMLDNMIGDDTGDNISHLNRYFAEMTAIYWAWKNYDKLGNPDYIGLAHYRRMFKDEDVKSVPQYDIVAAKDKVYYHENIADQFNNYHCTNDLNDAVDVLSKIKPEYAQDIKNYLNQPFGYFYNMFIMKKDLFFEYCDLVFNVLFQLHENIDYDNLTFCNQRMPAYVAERLTGIFITHKKHAATVNDVKAMFKDIDVARPIKPIFDDAICVCLSADDNYAKYLGVTIASIKEKRNSEDNYDICVLDGGISKLNKTKILKLAEKNFSIRFINISGFIDNLDKKIFSLNAHFSIATYFRFFIPQIFVEYKKIVYIDCDLVVNADVAELYNTDLEGFALGAVRDTELLRELKTDARYNKNELEYLTKKLKMTKPFEYFQAGVLVLDIERLKQDNFTEKCISRLVEIGEPLYVDQCVLNSLFDGKYKHISAEWNVLWHLPIYRPNLDRELNVKSYEEYMNSRKNPKVVHYASGIKPWVNPGLDLADIWWKYARTTPFYEEFLSQLTSKQENGAQNDQKAKIARCKTKLFMHKMFYRFSLSNKMRQKQKRCVQDYVDLLRDIMKQ